jgi:hypothetical protein
LKSDNGHLESVIWIAGERHTPLVAIGRAEALAMTDVRCQMTDFKISKQRVLGMLSTRAGGFGA